MKRVLLLSLILLLQTACQYRNFNNPLPGGLASKAVVSGFDDVRTDYTNNQNPLIKRQSLERVKQLAKNYPETMFQRKGVFTLLIISGGADYGAFGTGILNGWTKSGTRPKFTTVTGISTGALIAPFAFADPKYDSVLKTTYTTTTTKDVLTKKPLLWTLISGSDSLMDTKPLKNLIASYVDEKLLNDIAKGFQEGRRLYVGTTNLYSRKLIVWDMTRIAASRNPKKIELFRKVLLASASIPVIMPPVKFDVIANEKTYTEMHVDGGATFSVFLSHLGSDVQTAKAHFQLTKPPRVKIYVIRNNQNRFHYKVVKPRLFAIGKQAVASVIASQGAADVDFIYLCALLGKVDFNLANVPNEFYMDSDELFDIKRMQKLYHIGYVKAIKGYPWQKIPPDVKLLHNV